MKIKIFLGIIFIGMIISCSKDEMIFESPQITVDNNPAIAGEAVTFTIKGGNYEFISFFAGKDSTDTYDFYPVSSGIALAKSATTYRYLYNSHSTVNPTFVFTSYGNWGQESKSEIISLFIEINDNRTGINSFYLKEPKIGGLEFEGVIDEVNSKIQVKVNATTNTSKLITQFTLESKDAIVKKDGTVINNLDRIDYSSGNVTLTITAPDGTKQDWTVALTEE